MRGISQPNKTRKTVLTNWEDIAAGLPHPRDVWRWSETPMSHRCLYNLKEMGLIVPARTDKYWTTTETLWEYVQETALPGEDIGAAVRMGKDRESVTDSLPPVSDPADASQETLTGWVESYTGDWTEATVSTRSLTTPSGRVY